MPHPMGSAPDPYQLVGGDLIDNTNICLSI
jgi:hypothetical protein